VFVFLVFGARRCVFARLAGFFEAARDARAAVPWRRSSATSAARLWYSAFRRRVPCLLPTAYSQNNRRTRKELVHKRHALVEALAREARAVREKNGNAVV
jgi:hypothetical protein